MEAAPLGPHGPNLRLLRVRHGVSRASLARRLRRSAGDVWHIENAVKVAPSMHAAYVAAVEDIVMERERLTLSDLG